MQPIREATALDAVTDFLAEHPTDLEILEWQLPDPLVQRAHDLLERNGEGLLNQAERQEMFDFMRIDQMMTLLKAKTMLKMQTDSQ